MKLLRWFIYLLSCQHGSHEVVKSIHPLLLSILCLDHIEHRASKQVISFLVTRFRGQIRPITTAENSSKNSPTCWRRALRAVTLAGFLLPIGRPFILGRALFPGVLCQRFIADIVHSFGKKVITSLPKVFNNFHGSNVSINNAPNEFKHCWTIFRF